MSESTTILVVDDSKVSRIMSIGLLKKLLPTAQIHEVSNADDARVVIETQPIDLILLDHNMPGLTGLDLAEQLRTTRPDLKIALLTANIQDATQQRAAEAGVSFFKKPINETVIQDVIRLLSA